MGRRPRIAEVLRTGALVLALVVAVGAGAACGGASGGASGGGSGDGARPARVATRAGGLADAPAPVTTIVALLQEELTRLGYDVGPVDDGTVDRVGAALRQLQVDRGLPPTGALDQATAIELRRASGRTAPTVVRAVQSVLTELGVYRGPIDGVYGAATITAVTRLRERADLAGDHGRVDAAALRAMVEAWHADGLAAPRPRRTSGPLRLRLGDSGPRVARLQRRLTALGYRPGTPDGQFGVETLSAVTAFQKREGLRRDGTAGRTVRQRLLQPRGAGPQTSAPVPRLEVDVDRQIAFFVSRAGVTTLDVSTGDGRTFTAPDTTTPHVGATPVGTFAVERAVPTTVAAPVGTLYLPLYFDGGWAIHGGPVVPPYPASHGCVRTHDWDQAWLFAQVPVGTPVVVVGAGASRPLPSGAAAGY